MNGLMTFADVAHERSPPQNHGSARCMSSSLVRTSASTAPRFSSSTLHRIPARSRISDNSRHTSRPCTAMPAIRMVINLRSSECRRRMTDAVVIDRQHVVIGRGLSIEIKFRPLSRRARLTWPRTRMRLIQIRLASHSFFVLSNTPSDIGSVYFDHSTRSIHTMPGRAQPDSIRQNSNHNQSFAHANAPRPELIESIFRGLSDVKLTKGCIHNARFFSSTGGGEARIPGASQQFHIPLTFRATQGAGRMEGDCQNRNGVARRQRQMLNFVLVALAAKYAVRALRQRCR